MTELETKPLTGREKDVLEVFTRLTIKSGFPPTYQQMGDVFKIRKATVWEHVNNLIAKGYLVRRSRSTHGLRLNAKAPCPLCGKKTP